MAYYVPHRACCFMAHCPTSISLLWHPCHPKLGCYWVTFFKHNLGTPFSTGQPLSVKPWLVRNYEEACACVLFRQKALLFDWPRGLHVGRATAVWSLLPVQQWCSWVQHLLLPVGEQTGVCFGWELDLSCPIQELESNKMAWSNHVHAAQAMQTDCVQWMTLWAAALMAD